MTLKLYALIILFIVISISISTRTFSVTLFAILLAIFAVILIITLMKRFFDFRKSNAKYYNEDDLIIQNVKEGGVIKLANVLGYDKDLELKVIGRNLYMEGDYSWYELECVDSNGEKFWVDVDDDDTLTVSIVLSKIPINKIKSNKSYNQIDEDEEGNVRYDNVRYEYIDSGEAIYYKHCDDKFKERVQYWDFKNANFLISVEHWKNDNGKSEQLAYYSQIIRPSAITVYSTKKEGSV